MRLGLSGDVAIILFYIRKIPQFAYVGNRVCSASHGGTPLVSLSIYCNVKSEIANAALPACNFIPIWRQWYHPDIDLGVRHAYARHVCTHVCTWPVRESEGDLLVHARLPTMLDKISTPMEKPLRLIICYKVPPQLHFPLISRFFVTKIFVNTEISTSLLLLSLLFFYFYCNILCEYWNFTASPYFRCCSVIKILSTLKLLICVVGQINLRRITDYGETFAILKIYVKRKDQSNLQPVFIAR